MKDSSINVDHINILREPLQKILNAELASGNEVVETSLGWPNENSLIIFLKNPFIGVYKIEGIEFEEVNDPHYWKSQYRDIQHDQTLACKF